MAEGVYRVGGGVYFHHEVHPGGKVGDWKDGPRGEKKREGDELVGDYESYVTFDHPCQGHAGSHRGKGEKDDDGPHPQEHG